MSDDRQVGETPKRRDDVFGRSFAEVLLGRIAAQIGEGQHGDRGMAALRRRRASPVEIRGKDAEAKQRHDAQLQQSEEARRRDLSACDRWAPRTPTCTRYTRIGSGIFFTVLVAEIIPANRQFALDLLVDAAGNAHSTGLRESLQPRRDIDAIAHQVVALDHHVADVDSDAELHPAVVGERGCQSSMLCWIFKRGAHCLHGAGEFRNDAVAGAAEDPAFVRADDRGDPLATVLKRPIGSLLIGAHHAGIARAIGGEDCR